MKRLLVILAAAFVFAPNAGATLDAGPTPFHAVTAAPTVEFRRNDADDFIDRARDRMGVARLASQ